MKDKLRDILLFAAILIAFPACQPEKEQKQVTVPPKTETATPQKPAGDSLARFEFSSDACEKAGYYAKGKYTKDQLQNTYELLPFSYPVFKTVEILERPEDINSETEAKTLEKLDAEFASLRENFSSAKVVPVPFWENIKKLRLLELEEFYKLKRLTLQAHTNPQVLLQSPYAKACPEYVKALAASDTTTLFQGRRKLLKEAQKQNSAPENLARRYKEEYNSPDRVFLAKKELLQYGWWNCANRQRKYDEIENQYPLMQEFNKLFVKIDADCADAD